MAGTGVPTALFVHPRSDARFAGETIDSEASGVSVEGVTVRETIERLPEADAAGLVVDPAVTAADLAALLSSVRDVAPSLPVVYCVTERTHQLPEPPHGERKTFEQVVVEGAEAVAAVIEEELSETLSLSRALVGDYRRLFEQAPVPMGIYDSDGTLVFVNEAAADLVNADDPETLYGKPVGQFVAERSADIVAERRRRLLEERESIPPAEIEVRTLDGNRRYVEVAGAPVVYRGEPCAQVVINDLTERYRREQRLQRERDRLNALFESVPQPVVHVRFEEGVPIVKHVNAAFEETFGYDAGTLRGESLNDYIVPEDRQPEARKIDDTSLENNEIQREVIRDAVDGRREFLFESTVFETDDGTVEGIGSYTDISEQKEHQRELEAKNQHLEAFANVVSHDLRNPLNVIDGRLTLARETGADEHFEAIERNTERMEALIDDLLTLARQGESLDETRSVALESVAEDAWEMVDTAPATLVCEGNLGTVEADRNRLAQLFGNLFRNAVEHGTENGPEEVTVRVGRTDGRFYVADDGPGIPEDERDQIFEIGYSTAEDGTGYGLAIVDEIADAHDWDVRVTNGREGGARFEFRIDRD